VVHTNKGSVSCWDTVTSQRVAHLNNEKEWFYIQPNALCTEIMGKALIGAWIRYVFTLPLTCRRPYCIAATGSSCVWRSSASISAIELAFPFPKSSLQRTSGIQFPTYLLTLKSWDSAQ
jgi:hypothetical protein